MKVTLTFDNGPDPGGTTEHVLRVLRDANVRSTFFVTGQQLLLPGAMALAARARREGHWIGNHTFTPFDAVRRRRCGPNAAGSGNRRDATTARRTRLAGTMVQALRCGRHGTAFVQSKRDRLPGARSLQRRALELHTARLGRGRSWVDRCIADVQTREWSVVLMHDLPTGAMRFLESLLDQLRSIGADFVQTFPEECVPMERGRVRSDLGPFTSVR